MSAAPCHDQQTIFCGHCGGGSDDANVDPAALPKLPWSRDRIAAEWHVLTETERRVYEETLEAVKPQAREPSAAAQVAIFAALRVRARRNRAFISAGGGKR